MAPPDNRRDANRRALGKAASIVLAFGVFLSGWMAMRTDDWRRMVLWTVIAAGCGWFASRAAARGR